MWDFYQYRIVIFPFLKLFSCFYIRTFIGFISFSSLIRCQIVVIINTK